MSAVACRPCLDVICDNPPDVGAPEIFATVPFTFLISCPPGFICQVNQQVVVIPPNVIPPIRPPPPFGRTVTVRLDGCISPIIRSWTTDTPQDVINQIINQMQAEWAAQQATCNFIKCPAGVDCDGHPPPTRPPGGTNPQPKPILFDFTARFPPLCVGTRVAIPILARNFGGLPIVWSIPSGSLPPGLTGEVLGGSNTQVFFISGTPTTSGTYSFLIHAVDNSGNVAQHAYTVTVLEINVDTALPQFSIGIPYSFQFTILGDPGPFLWTVLSGTLPSGLTLSVDGLLSGTPTGANGTNFDFTICANK